MPGSSSVRARFLKPGKADGMDEQQQQRKVSRQKLVQKARKESTESLAARKAQEAFNERVRFQAAAEPEPAADEESIADEVSIADIHMAHAASLDEARRSSRAAAEDPDLDVTAAFESMELGVTPTEAASKKALDAGVNKAKAAAEAAKAAHLAAQSAQVELHDLLLQHEEAVAPPPVRRHGKGAAEKDIRDRARDRVRRAAGVVADPMAADSTKSPKSRKSRKSPTPSSPAAKPAKKPGKGKGGKAKAKSAARRKITSPRRKRRQSRRRKRASRSR